MGTSGACSNKRSRKDKYSNGLEFSARPRRKRRENEEELLYNECGQEDKLL